VKYSSYNSSGQLAIFFKEITCLCDRYDY